MSKEPRLYSLNNMNDMTEKDDKSCGLSDMNCVGDEEKDSSLTDMNCLGSEDDTTCSLENMNCEE